MKRFAPLALFFGSLLLFNACTTALDEEAEENQPDYAALITGTYQYSTYFNGKESGAGTAIVSKSSGSSILISTDQSISFKAEGLQKIDEDMRMEIPVQEVDYYGMPGSLQGRNAVNRAGSLYQGVYFGAEGRMELALRLTIEGSTDEMLLILER
jgi:hypothetical protein